MSEEKKKEKNKVSHLNWHQHFTVKQILEAARDNKILQGSLENLYRCSGFLTMIENDKSTVSDLILLGRSLNI